MPSRLLVSATLCILAIGALAPRNAHAVASFSRQTGLPCSACHTTFPELTAFGRQFKLSAYTLSSQPTISSSDLSLLKSIPLSASVHASLTETNKRQPQSADPSTEFPQTINIYLAGRVTPHFGTYIQMTYANSADHFTVDNSDVRYARQTTWRGKPLTWGIDANNNPGYEDLWNSIPTYDFPYDATPDSAGFVPQAAALIDGGLAQQVVGAGPYAMWDNHLYGLVDLYRSQHIGTAQPETGVGFLNNIQGVAPYWRLAWQQNVGKTNYFELGTYGIYIAAHPNAVSGPTDHYTDLGLDGTYERFLANGDLITVHSTYIHERSDRGASLDQGLVAVSGHTLSTWRLDANYHFGHRATLTAGPFITWGTGDVLLYAPGTVTGFANGRPDTGGYIVQAQYVPWENLELGVQYRGFTKFDGARTNYDGAGRNASDNNTLYVFMWLNF